jgi:hypothetical protein
VAVIDLDLPASPPATTAPPPVHRHRHLALLLAGLLVLALGGAAPAAPVLWRHVGSVPLTDAEVVHMVAGDRLYLTTVTDRPVMTGWQVDPPRKLWSVPVPGQVAGAPSPLGDSLLLHLDPGSAALDAATGAVRWTSPVPVGPLNARVGLSTVTRFAPGTEYDQSSGDPGPLYFSSDGQPHTAPPLHTDLNGVDLATGRRLWSVRERGAVYAVPVPENSAALAVVTADAVELRDAATGASLRRRSLPRAGAGEVWYPEVAGGVLLVRRGNTATAYGLDTLEPRWERAEPAEAAGVPSCAGLLCRRTAGSLDVVDVRTGRTAWGTGQPDAQLAYGGGEVLVSGHLTDRPQRVVDLATGAVRVDLSRWDTLVDFTDDGELMVTRYDGSHTGRVFGLRSPGEATVRTLGASATLMRDCVRSPALVACRGTDRIEVFAYRAGR